MWDFTYHATLKIYLQVLSGAPKIYAYICESMRNCRDINKDFIKSNENSMFKMNETLSELDIPNEVNECHKDNPNGLKMRCVPIILVLCEGNVECEYKITMKNQEDNILLSEK